MWFHEGKKLFVIGDNIQSTFSEGSRFDLHTGKVCLSGSLSPNHISEGYRYFTRTHIDYEAICFGDDLGHVVALMHYSDNIALVSAGERQ
ncbi:hypothetical protein PAMP_018895 [Pampus punctatissimus]